MNNHFILISLILAISSSVNCVELRRICADDVFRYRDHEINSVHVIKLNVSLKEVAYFAIDPNEEFEDFGDTFRDQMLSVKKEHNKRLVKLYSERYLNQNESILDSLDEMGKNTTELRYKIEQSESEEQNDQYFVLSKLLLTRNQISKLTHLIEYLSSFFDNKFPQENSKIPDQIGKKELKLKLKSIIENLNVTENQTSAFIDVPIYEIYEKQIVKPKFTFFRLSKLSYDFRSTGQLELDIVLPFEDKIYNKINNDVKIDCLKAKDLPKFYQEKPNEL